MSRNTDYGSLLTTPVLFCCFFGGLALVISAMATFFLAPFDIAGTFPSVLVVDDLASAIQRGSIGVILILLAEVGDAFLGPEYVVTDNGLDDGLMLSIAVQGGLLLVMSGISMYFFLNALLVIISTIPLLLEFPRVSPLVDAFVGLFEIAMWLFLGFLFLALAMFIDRDKEDNNDQQPEATTSSLQSEFETVSREDTTDDGGETAVIEKSSTVGKASASATVEEDKTEVFTESSGDKTETQIYEGNSSSKPTCPDCGVELPVSNAKYCGQCGTQLD